MRLKEPPRDKEAEEQLVPVISQAFSATTRNSDFDGEWDIAKLDYARCAVRSHPPTRASLRIRVVVRGSRVSGAQQLAPR